MHTSPSNKVYIGITSQDPEKRWGKGCNYKKQKYFYAAIQKYGWDNIRHEILFSNLTENEAKQREIELIAKHKSNDRNFGYNLTQGGDGVKGYVPTEETKEQIKKTLKKMYEDPEFREKQRLMKPRGEIHHCYGKSLSEEHREKLRVSHLGKKRGPHTEETKAKIANSNLGKKKPHVGVARSPECREKIGKAKNKAVLQFSKDGSFIKEYPSGKEASLQTGIAAKYISRCCCGKQKTAKGFIWELKNNYLEVFNYDSVDI